MITQHLIGVCGVAIVAASLINGYFALILIGVGLMLSLLPAK